MAKTKKVAQALENSVSAQPKQDNDWETEDHMRTLIRAHEIVNDKEKMGKVHKLAGRHKKAIRSISDLKDTYNEKYGGDNARKSSLDSFKDTDQDGE